MKQRSFPLLLTVVAIVLSPLVASADGTLPEKEAKLPGPAFEQAATVLNRVYGVNDKGHLMMISTLWGNKRDYGTFDRKLLKSIDVANDMACLVTTNEVCEVNLASGKITRTASHELGKCGAGFIDENRVFAHNGSTLQIFDLQQRKVLHTVKLYDETGERERALRKADKNPLIGHAKAANLLYVVRPYQTDIAVVDLEKGQRAKSINMPGYADSIDLHVDKEQLVVRGMSVSYGIIHDTLFLVDLKTGKPRQLKFPQSDSKKMRMISQFKRFPSTALVGCESGGFYVASYDGVYQFNSEGELIAEAPQALKNGGELVGSVRNAVVVASKGVSRVKLTPTSKSKLARE